MEREVAEKILDLVLKGEHKKARELGIKYTLDRAKRKRSIRRKTEDLAQRINEYLKNSGCTKTAFAKKVGISSQFLNYLLRCERNASEEVYKEIDDFLNRWGY